MRALPPIDSAESNTQSHSCQVVKKPRTVKKSRTNYPPDVVHLVKKLRAASYKLGGTDLAYLFEKIDKDNSGSLDADEFKRVIRWFVYHACHCVIIVVSSGWLSCCVRYCRACMELAKTLTSTSLCLLVL